MRAGSAAERGGTCADWQPNRPRMAMCAAARRALVWLVVLAAGCEPDPVQTTLPLALRQLGSCPLGDAPQQIEVTALGDFQSRSVQLDGDRPGTAFERLPAQTRVLAVRAVSATGALSGRRSVSSDAALNAQPLWLLPEDSSCPLADDLVRLVDGAVASALPGSGLLLAGGIVPDASATLASSEALLLREGSEAAQPVPGGMLLRRAYASASALGSRLVLAGGTADLRGTAHDTYEVYDAVSERFPAALSGKLATPRMQHAAHALADGRVLLVGGRAEAQGAPLASAELLDPTAGSSELLEGSRGLVTARVAPSVLALDSGTILVVGGRDAAQQIVPSIERFERDHFTVAADELPVAQAVAVSALPGARVGWLACDRGRAAACRFWLLAERTDGFEESEVALPFADWVPSGLSELVLSPLAGGRLLLTAADDSDPTGRRRAFAIDPVAQTLTRLDATRVPRQLITLDSGAIVELEAEGASLRAAGSLGQYASLEGDALAPEQARYLALDGPAHWARDETGLTALVQGARLDLDELRFAAFTLELTLLGDGVLIVYDGASTPQRITIGADTLQLGECSVPRVPGVKVTVARSGSAWTASAGGAECQIAWSDAPVGIGVTAGRAARIDGLRVLRR